MTFNSLAFKKFIFLFAFENIYRFSFKLIFIRAQDEPVTGKPKCISHPSLLDLEDNLCSMIASKLLGILVFKAVFSPRQKQHQNIKHFLLLA
jgi:hypothetical protein